MKNQSISDSPITRVVQLFSKAKKPDPKYVAYAEAIVKLATPKCPAFQELQFDGKPAYLKRT